MKSPVSTGCYGFIVAYFLDKYNLKIEIVIKLLKKIGLETDTGSCQEDRPFFLSVLKGLLDLHKILRRPFAERKFPKKESYPVDNVDNFVYNPKISQNRREKCGVLIHRDSAAEGG